MAVSWWYKYGTEENKIEALSSFRACCMQVTEKKAILDGWKTVPKKQYIICEAINWWNSLKEEQASLQNIPIMPCNTKKEPRKFRHNIVRVAVDPWRDSRVDPQTTLTMLWKTSLSITGQTHVKLMSSHNFTNSCVCLPTDNKN